MIQKLNGFSKGSIMLFISFFVLSLRAQDAHYSQYYNAPMHINPALTGVINGGTMRFTSNYRSQWAHITVPYITTSGSFDMNFLNGQVGAGLFVLNSTAGDLKYQTLNVMVSGSYNLAFGSDKFYHAVIGIQAGVVNKSVDFSKAIFGDQYSNGAFAGTTQENISSNSITFPDFGAGLLWYYDNEDESRGIVPFAGFASYHLAEPNESFGLSQIKELNKSPLHRRYTGYGGAKIILSERFTFTPQVLYMNQNAAREIYPVITSRYGIKDFGILFGLSYRTKDAAIAMTGVEYKKIAFAFSYDVNTSPLKTVSDSKGGFELSLTWQGGGTTTTKFPQMPFIRY